MAYVEVRKDDKLILRRFAGNPCRIGARQRASANDLGTGEGSEVVTPVPS